MAEEVNKSNKRSARRKNPTVRERTQQTSKEKPKRLRKTAGTIASPFKRAHKTTKKEYNVVPLPDNKAGRILGKRVRIVPKYFREAWGEIKLVTWPNRKETIRLTIAVFVFALVFALIVGGLDFVLDKIFRRILL